MAGFFFINFFIWLAGLYDLHDIVLFSLRSFLHESRDDPYPSCIYVVYSIFFFCYCSLAYCMYLARGALCVYLVFLF